MSINNAPAFQYHLFSLVVQPLLVRLHRQDGMYATFLVFDQPLSFENLA